MEHEQHPHGRSDRFAHAWLVARLYYRVTRADPRLDSLRLAGCRSLPLSLLLLPPSLFFSLATSAFLFPSLFLFSSRLYPPPVFLLPFSYSFLFLLLFSSLYLLFGAPSRCPRPVERGAVPIPSVFGDALSEEPRRRLPGGIVAGELLRVWRSFFPPAYLFVSSASFPPRVSPADPPGLECRRSCSASSRYRRANARRSPRFFFTPPRRAGCPSPSHPSCKAYCSGAPSVRLWLVGAASSHVALTFSSSPASFSPEVEKKKKNFPALFPPRPLPVLSSLFFSHSSPFLLFPLLPPSSAPPFPVRYPRRPRDGERQRLVRNCPQAIPSPLQPRQWASRPCVDALLLSSLLSTSPRSKPRTSAAGISRDP